jgi:ATP-binding cassette, subfamily F, member 3
MIALSLSNVSLVLGARPIFRNLFWEIQHDQRIGLIGPNGAGKSSLFKLIVGEHVPEPGGAVVRAKGVTVGYLPQAPEFEPGRTVLDVALSGQARLAEVEAELLRLEAKLGDPKVHHDTKALTRSLEAQQKYLEEYEQLGGATYEGRVRETLRGLGLGEPDLGKPVETLSGGQKKLVGLVRLLLAQPAVLLLDEPDNHLDLAGKAYLEQLMLNYPGAVVLVSHDRYLLDAVVTQIAEIEAGELTLFVGDYSAYVIDKEARLARQEELYQVQQRQIARLEMALKRYQLWVQRSDKFASRVRSMKSRLAQVDRRDRPTLERRRMELALTGWRGSAKVLELIGVRKAFGAVAPLREINLLMRHGERVGLVGANGAGKSVLLRLITEQETPDAGQIKIGPSVKLGYYAQEHETLDFAQTPLELVRRTRPITEQGAVAFLNRYLFSYRQTSQPIRELSGGERSRLQLAVLVLSGANFLLLDEPTNNLDIASAEVLESALDDFEGTVLLISHDRYFLDRTVGRIVELGGGTLTEYVGGYSDYAEKKALSSDGTLC